MDSKQENFYYGRILKKKISVAVVAARRWVLKRRIFTTKPVVNAAGNGGGKGPLSLVKKHYKILKEQDIRQLQENDISTVSRLLPVSRGLACALLCRNNWNPQFACDEWLADDERETEPVVGILAERESQEQVCKICYEEIRPQNIVSASCGHPICADCWETYIAASINDGPGCLTLHCPGPACKATVGLDMVESLASAHDKYRYYRYLYRSYVESNRNRKWCPAPGCDLVIELHARSKCKSYEVTCDCSHKFCWKCMAESHRPVDCETAADWLQEDSTEVESAMWIQAHTKPCPKCCRPIQKIGGCNFIICPYPCGGQFCWVCLGPWSPDKCYLCNEYEVESVDRHEKSRMNAKKHWNRYTRYYKKCDSIDELRKSALVYLNRARAEMLASCQLGEPRARLQFVIETWEQIVEFRRVLKWTYVYGYYLSRKNFRETSYFKDLQRKAEAALESLHDCADTEMVTYHLQTPTSFSNLQLKLVDLTEVARNEFGKLVIALENNPSAIKTSKTSKSSKNRKG